MKTMTVDELQARRLEGHVQLLDVREPGEYRLGHVPCAVNLPMDQLEGRLADIRPQEPVVLICQSGRRAAVCQALLAPYREDVFVLEGGTSAWEQAGLPVVRGRSTRWSIERQVRLAAGLVTAAGAALALAVHPVWGAVPASVGAGLAVAALTNRCGLAAVLAHAPWNRAAAVCPPRQADASCSARPAA